VLRVEARQMYRSNGLIDDFVVYGFPNDYLELAEMVESALSSKKPTKLKTSSSIDLEIILNNEESQELFTSLQNEGNEYLSMQEWQERNILRIMGNGKILNELHAFLIDLSGRGEGYSYISEYSESFKYSPYSPEWRLHVDNT